MVAAVCYAWLLENKLRQSNAESGPECLVVPVMNMQRGKMWNQRQVAWLFYHLGLDASSILFTDEVLVFLVILLIDCSRIRTINKKNGNYQLCLVISVNHVINNIASYTEQDIDFSFSKVNEPRVH